jgi:hypothetical protein
MHQRTPAMGGRKRKGGRSKTAKKGGFYGFNGALATGAADWKTGTEMPSGMSSRGGNTMAGGRRKRKGGKKTRRPRRGGGSFAQANAGFTGVGTARGLGGYQDVSAPTGKAAGGEFNNYGAQPGSGYGSFNILNK